VIQNPAAYYANIKELSLISEDGEFVVNKNELIAPHAQVAWEINNNINMLKDFKIKLTLVNDYGALVVHEITLNK
ncbi:molecular chaperone, partial [Acinetobacter bereziniae]|nr:molecular chaperone [Acinetobacter bereziniae]MBJ8458447.1 molecular chaperone [Acinetobacter bereziniae]